MSGAEPERESKREGEGGSKWAQSNATRGELKQVMPDRKIAGPDHATLFKNSSNPKLLESRAEGNDSI